MEAQAANHNHMNQIFYPREIIQKYNVRGKPYKIFTNHDEVYHDIIKNDYNEIHLLHLDAHSDIMDTNNENINPGNWINHLVMSGRCNKIEWINTNRIYISETLTIDNESCEYIESNFLNHTFDGEIDIVYYTLSPEWAPKNNLVVDFKKYINV